jgi:hypothetical protein
MLQYKVAERKLWDQRSNTHSRKLRHKVAEHNDCDQRRNTDLQWNQHRVTNPHLVLNLIIPISSYYKFVCAFRSMQNCGRISIELDLSRHSLKIKPQLIMQIRDLNQEKTNGNVGVPTL